MNEDDLRTIKAMEKYGGSFVRALAGAARLADRINLDRIKRAWPDYWARYEDMADRMLDEEG